MNWENQWQCTMSQMNKVSTINYWNKRADDYNNFIKTSCFSYGEEIVRIISENDFLDQSMQVLEIAGGVGALTLPLCRSVKSVTTVEPAENMVAKMRHNAKDQQIENVTIIMDTCQKVAEHADLTKHDLSIMCHASWQFPDLRWLVNFMEKFGNGKVCIADSIPSNNSDINYLNKQLGIQNYCLDRFYTLTKVLQSFYRNPNIQHFPFTMKRSSDSAKAMITQVLSKERKPEQMDIELIENYVTAHSHSDIYTEEVTMGVLWWENTLSQQ